jgi:hypothetical protein
MRRETLEWRTEIEKVSVEPVTEMEESHESGRSAQVAELSVMTRLPVEMLQVPDITKSPRTLAFLRNNLYS